MKRTTAAIAILSTMLQLSLIARSMLLAPILFALVVYPASGFSQVTRASLAQPAHLTSEQDHQRMMDLLHITSLRRGADGDPKSPYAANYDESKANPYPKIPDPLRAKGGKGRHTQEGGGGTGAPEDRGGVGPRSLRPRAEHTQSELGSDRYDEGDEWRGPGCHQEIGWTRGQLSISACERGHRPHSDDASECKRSSAGDYGIQLESGGAGCAGQALSGDERRGLRTLMAAASAGEGLGLRRLYPDKCASGQWRRIDPGRDRACE